MLDEHQFRDQADAALEALHKSLVRAADDHEFEADFNNGAMTIEFEAPPAKFVVSPNTPVRQVWVSAHSRSFKLDWVPEQNAFVLPETGQTLKEMVQGAITQQLGEEVTLA